jgi:hypothetical protein
MFLFILILNLILLVWITMRSPPCVLSYDRFIVINKHEPGIEQQILSLYNEQPLFVYNPSFLDYDGKTVFIIRISSFTISRILNTLHYVSYVGMGRWDNNRIQDFWLYPVDPSFYDLKVPRRHYGLEDGRLFTVHNGLYGIFNYSPVPGRVQPIVYKMEPPFTRHLFPNYSATEKNWIPFVYYDTLYFQYSLSPFTILEYDLSSNQVRERYHSLSSMPSRRYHGGVIAQYPIYIRKYQDFFYCGISNVKYFYAYYQCFYVFRADPPFHLFAHTPLFRIQPNKSVQFVTSMQYRPDTMEMIVGMGVMDDHAILATIPFERLSRLLQRIYDTIDKHPIKQ